MDQNAAPVLDHATILNDATLWSRIAQQQFDVLLAQEVGPDAQIGVDLEAGQIQFASEQGEVVGDLHLVASVAPGPRSLLWAWANENFAEAPAARLSHELREFGELHGTHQLTDAEIVLDASDEELDDAVVTAAHDAGTLASKITGVRPYFVSDAGNGTWVVTLVSGLDLPVPALSDLPELLRSVLDEGVLTDHRRALHHLGIDGPWPATWAADGRRVRFDDGEQVVEVELDEDGWVREIHDDLR
ncbi:hypothetical protein SAMN05445756_1791 [Kytococcus aerolatus]|uniref:Uncharacterized protein n=1 Tax=Kytococcus aerolatus TaxID=592308 RepID=A0A212U2D1_9MICO|nr:DUF6882 domain-containing protein [Kytococcus aerolatus]SNC72284.1 hypothetical protein SAMN05445756_1791 [Kytococcus aerolatus]